MIKLTAEVIHGFTGSVLSGGFDEPAPTPDCHREWWDLCCSHYKRVAIAAPRGHAKSTAITKAYTLASVLFRDRSFVLIVSDTYKQAVQFLGEIKRELEFNEVLRDLFEVKEFLTDREDDVVVVLKDGYQFRITALGSEQKVRGILWNNKRPDLVVGDDLENDEIVMNPERRDKFNKWLFNALLPAMSHRGVVRLIGTILHMDAALERLMPRDRDSNTIHDELKSYMRYPMDGWMSVRYKAHNEDYTKLLWPIKWSEEKFREIRAMFSAQGNPEGYYQEYLNRPIDPHHTFFKKDDFGDFQNTDYDRSWEYAPTYLSLDGAWTTKERRDWTVLGVGSVGEDGILYLRHVIRDRLDPKETVDQICRLQDRYKFSVMLVGKGAYEKGIAPFLTESMYRKGRFLHIDAIPETTDKRHRAVSIRGRMRSGGVKFNKKAGWFADLEQELLEFDKSKYDDQVDMMSLFGLYLDKLMDSPTHTQIMDIELEEEYENMIKVDGQQGRNSWTGY